MCNNELILAELREIKAMIKSIQPNEVTIAKVPEAARLLKISPAKLREMCKEGKIPCAPLSNNQNRQHMVDVPAARKVLLSGSHLVSKPKRKSKYTIL